MTAVNKKKQLTENQRELMRRSLQKFSEGDVVIVYGFAKKQSGSGLFSNERLILLHSGQKSIRYYSKQPADLPFDKLSEVANGKAKVIVDKVTNFKCESIKTSSVKIQWDQGSAHNIWQFSFQNAKMAHQWVAAVEQMVADKINKDPTFSQPTNKNSAPNTPIGNLSPLMNSSAQPASSSKLNQPSIKQPNPQTSTNPTNNNNASFILGESPRPPIVPNNQSNAQSNQQTQGQPPSIQNSQILQTNPNDKNVPQNLNQAAIIPKTQSMIQSPTQPINQPSQRSYGGDVASEIRDLRSKQPQRFQLTNDLSRKNLGQDTTSPLNMPNDNVETRRDPSSSQPSNISFKKNQLQPAFLKPEPAASGASGNSSLQNSRGNFQSSQQSRVTQQQPSIANKLNQAEFSNASKMGSQAYGPESNLQSRAESNFTNVANNNPSARKQVSRPPSTRNKTASTRKWNELWCTVGSQVQIYEEFVKCCQDISVNIIDELPLLKANRQYSPIKFEGPYFMYDVAGITFNMHFFEDSSPLESSRDADERAPLLFDQESYYEAKRQFYNLNFVLGVTGNKGLFKVPLSCYVEYKGVLIFCKANAPEGFDKVSPHFYERQLEQLEQVLKMRFIFNSMVVFAHPQKKYFLLMNLDELIPRIPIDVQPPVYFRRQFLMENNFMIEDQNSVKKLYQNLTSNNIKEFINRCETLELWVISSVDLTKELHRAGISLGCLPLIYEETNLSFLKKIIVSEMTKTTFCDILRSQLNSVYSSFPAKEFDELNLEYTDKIILDCAHVLLNQLFSYSSRSQNIWRMIVKQVNKKFKVVISKEDILAGYLLGGIMDTIGIDCDYKTPQLNRKESFFIRKSSLPRQLLLHFYPKMRRYDLQSVSPVYAHILELLEMEPNPDNFEEMVRTLNLKSKPIPSFLSHLQPEIVTYMCNFIPLGEHDQFEQIGIYDMLEQEPHTYCSTKVCLLGIKWAAKKKNEELANKIFEVKYEQNGYWVSEFNPAISEYYDFFSLYNVSTGNYEESIRLAKSSLVNSIKLSGANSLPVADKHYQLGNIEFKIGQKEEALKQYLKTKQILEQHRQTSIPEYGIILLKLALLYLNFGKIGECVGNSVAALKIFDTNGGSEQEEIETFEILSRSYQITRKAGDLKNVGLLCLQKFNKTENPKIFERMLKIVLLPRLASLSHEDAKTLLKLIAKIEQLDSPISNLDCFNYLHSRAESQVIMKRVFSFLDNLSNLYEQAMRKDLFRKHKCLLSQARSQAADMVVLLQAVFVMTGFNFVNGSLRENYY